MKTINYIYFLLLIVSLSSCASFSSKIVKDRITKLDTENIQSIEGSYEMGCYDSYYLSTLKKRKIKQFTNHKGLSNINYFINTNIADSIVNHKLIVDIKIVSKKKIQFTYRLKDVIITQTTLGMQLRKNGMLHLRNRETEIKGIPMVYGNISIEKSRIGLSKNKDLIVNNVHFLAGGFLVLMSDSKRDNTIFYFKRLNTTS